MVFRVQRGRSRVVLGLVWIIAAGLFFACRTSSRPSVLAAPAAAPYDWPQFNFDAQHSGNNTQETTIASANTGSLHRLYQASLPAVADGAPVFLTAVATANGTQDLLFVTTKAGHIVALDAHTGAQLWAHQSPAGTCRINNGGQACYTTSSPAIDPNRQYVYSYGLDGFVHKYRVGDGMEITGGGWPEPTSLKPFDEKGSSPLCLSTARDGTSYLYVLHAGYPGDRGDYQGHITAINLADGAQHVFNATCSDQPVHFVERPGTPDCAAVQTAIWARAGAVYDAETAPAVWTNPTDSTTWAFVANARGIEGLRLTVDASGTPTLAVVWQNAGGGSSPIVANGVLYVAGSNNLRALDPVTGSPLWSDTQIGGIHWESPIVASGVLYITDEQGHLTAYSP